MWTFRPVSQEFRKLEPKPQCQEDLAWSHLAVNFSATAGELLGCGEGGTR